MPNIASAKKRLRQSVRRTAINRGRRSRMRSSVRKVEEAIVAGDKSLAADALRIAEPILIRQAQNGVIHRNTAQRKVSRLARHIAAMEG